MLERSLEEAAEETAYRTSQQGQKVLGYNSSGCDIMPKRTIQKTAESHTPATPTDVMKRDYQPPASESGSRSPRVSI